MVLGPRSHRWKPPFAVVVVLLVLALGACHRGGGTADHATTSSDDAVAARLMDPNRQAPAAPIEGATKGGTVTVLSAFDAYPLPWDPTGSANFQTLILSGLVTRSLTQYVYDPDLDTMVLVPDIATDTGTPNPDFTEWTFTIRPGVKFEDGSTVTAQDVAYGIERSFDRHDFAAPTYSSNYFLHGDTYKGPYLSGTSYDGVVVDGDTLTLKMARPFPDLPYWAAFPAMGPIPDSGSDPATYWRHPMATGPYKFASDYQQKGESLTLVRNEQWDPATDPGRHQYPDRYKFSFTGDDEDIEATILGDTGEGQTTLSYDTPPLAVLRSALADASDQVTVGPTAGYAFLGLDCRKITDLRVRQAVGYAYPYDDVVAAHKLLDGVTSTPGSTILPPGTPGRIDYHPLSTEPGETDPVKAIALLKEAGYDPGEYTLKFPYATDDPVSVAQKNALVAGFEAGGFKVDPRPTTADAYNEVVGAPQAPFNIRPFGWGADWPSASGSLAQLVSSDGFINIAHFSEPSVDDEIERIGTLPLADQPAAWGALDQRVETDYYPYVMTWYGGAAMLHGSRIGGMNDDNTYGTPTWKDIYVIR